MSDLLRFDNVCAYYGSAQILDGLSFAIADGECFSLVGANGVGKTTSVNAMYGIARVRRGTIALAGRRLDSRRSYAPARLGAALIPQGRWILGNLTIEENLQLGAASRRPGPWDLARIYDMFPDLGQRRRAPGTALSGGQQQMLAIGRALMGNPRLLILDEPSEGLAPVVIDQLGDVLQHLRAEGMSMLLIEQRLDLVLRFSDRYAVIAKGRVVATGDSSDSDIETIGRLVTFA